MFGAALILGLASSLHCVGMCGPIALALPLNRSSRLTQVFGLLIYNFGRIMSYGALGFLFGSLGRGIHIFTQQQYLSILAGLFMLLLAFLPRSLDFFSSRYHWFVRFQNRWKQLSARFFKRSSPAALLNIGLLNGFLPCGMVYAALAGALASSGTFSGVVFMLFFGLGTLPLMFSVAFAGKLFSLQSRLRFQKMIPLFLAFVGLMLIVRGLGLNLGHFSPSLIANQAFIAICG